MAFQVLGFALWGFVAILGAWLVVTGRHLPFGLTIGTREGWQLRVIGLLYSGAGAFFAYKVIQGSFSPEGVFFSYLMFALVVWSARLRARTVERSQPGP